MLRLSIFFIDGSFSLCGQYLRYCHYNPTRQYRYPHMLMKLKSVLNGVFLNKMIHYTLILFLQNLYQVIIGMLSLKRISDLCLGKGELKNVYMSKSNLLYDCQSVSMSWY
jgi:hypothetical protein